MWGGRLAEELTGAALKPLALPGELSGHSNGIVVIGWADKPTAGLRTRSCLVYRPIDFVIRSFRNINGRDGRGAQHCAKQQQQ